MALPCQPLPQKCQTAIPLKGLSLLNPEQGIGRLGRVKSLRILPMKKQERALPQPAMAAIQDPEIYRIVLESMQIGVCAVDLENKIMFWNDGAERITGDLRHEVMGRSCADNIQLHCNHAKCELCPQRCPLATAVHSARPVEANGFFHHKAGHRTPVHIWAVPIRNQHVP